MGTLSSWFRRGLYEFMYWRGQPRWDTGVTPPELIDVVERQNFPRGRALDIGCGTGTNVVYLARHGFQVVGIDLIRRALRRARERAKEADVQVELREANVLEPLDLGMTFDLVLDLGCFHNFDASGRVAYARNLERWTRVGSIFMLYAFFPTSLGLRRFGVTPEAVAETFGRAFRIQNSTVGLSADQDSAWYRLERVN